MSTLPIVAAAAGAGLMALIAPRLLRERALRRQSVVPIAPATGGGAPVRIRGRVSLGAGEVTSPLTGRAGVFYEILVQDTGMTVHHEAAVAELLVRDGTAKALVRPGRLAARRVLTRVVYEEVPRGRVALEYLEAHGLCDPSPFTPGAIGRPRRQLK